MTPTANAIGQVPSWSGPSPWARLNLCWNPFGDPPADALPDLVVADVQPMLGWVAGDRNALQFLGEKGRGKTARLRALEDRLGFPYVYLAEGEPIPLLPSSGGLLLDEAQRLPKSRLTELLQSVTKLVLASHEDLTADLEAAGWSARTEILQGLTTAQLKAIVDRRLEWARRDVGSLPEVSRDTCGALIEKHRDDVRSILDRLYLDFQDRANSSRAL